MIITDSGLGVESAGQRYIKIHGRKKCSCLSQLSYKNKNRTIANSAILIFSAFREVPLDSILIFMGFSPAQD